MAVCGECGCGLGLAGVDSCEGTARGATFSPPLSFEVCKSTMHMPHISQHTNIMVSTQLDPSRRKPNVERCTTYSTFLNTSVLTRTTLISIAVPFSTVISSWKG